MENIDKFNKILTSEEEVLAIYKPRKLRMTLSSEIIVCLFLIAFVVPFLLSGLGFFQAEEETKIVFPFIFVAGLIFCFVIFMVISTIVSPFKTYYCLTDKRLIIRSGIIGVDYQSLELDQIKNASIDVNFIDKCFHPATGTISFCTNILNNQTKSNSSGFKFDAISEPYEVYKKIKEYIDERKADK